MNELFVEKLRNGMSADELYKELMSDLSEATQKVAAEKAAAAVKKEKDREGLLLKARACMISAIDFYGQWMGEAPLTEEEVKKMEGSLKDLEEIIKQTFALVQACGDKVPDSLAAFAEAEKKQGKSATNDFGLLSVLQKNHIV